MKRASNTLKLGQIESTRGANTNNYFKFFTSFLPCSCHHCLLSSSSEFCIFNEERTIKEETVIGKKAKDKHGISDLTVKEIRDELRERGLSFSGKKDELMSRLIDSIENSIASSEECQFEEEDTFSVASL